MPIVLTGEPAPAAEGFGRRPIDDAFCTMQRSAARIRANTGSAAAFLN